MAIFGAAGICKDFSARRQQKRSEERSGVIVIFLEVTGSQSEKQKWRQKEEKAVIHRGEQKSTGAEEEGLKMMLMSTNHGAASE